MIRLAPPDAKCHVLTFREGLLSGLGHDLELAVTQFEIRVDVATRTVEATFDPSSLVVLRALRDGRELPDGLSAGDRQTIEDTIRTHVLESRQHPIIRFRSTAVVDAEGGFDATGHLELHGEVAEIAVLLRRDGDRYRADVPLHQPDFGIRPYSALLGTLKVKPNVTVRLSLPSVPPAQPTAKAP